MTETEKNKYENRQLYRLVYQCNKHEDILSHWHVENSEASRIFTILNYLQKNKGWISIQKLAKKTKLPYGSVWHEISKMTGAIAMDHLQAGEYIPKIDHPLVFTKNTTYNKKSNLNPRLRKLKPAVYVKFGYRVAHI